MSDFVDQQVARLHEQQLKAAIEYSQVQSDYSVSFVSPRPGNGRCEWSQSIDCGTRDRVHAHGW
eukprot:COSAG02_NODE_17441_length_1003_cov_1.082965_1_plen_64_part_00